MKPEETVQIIDPLRFPLLRKAIDLILAGETPADVLIKLNADWGYRTRKTKKIGGNPLSATDFYKFLKDPFYY